MLKKPIQTRFGRPPRDIPVREYPKYYGVGFCDLVSDMIKDERDAGQAYTYLHTLCLAENEKSFISRKQCRSIRKILADENKHYDTLKQIDLRYCRGREP